MNVPKALIVSLAVHGALFLALMACQEYASQSDVVVVLDLSHVELSLTETSAEQAPAPPAVRECPLDLPKVPDLSLTQPVQIAPLPVTPPEIPAEIASRDPEPPINMVVEGRCVPYATPPPSDPAPQQARIDAPPRPQRPIRPDYPRGARRRGEQGDVVLEIAVGASGAVDGVQVVGTSGFAELDAAAVRAALSARFAPAKSGGVPMASVARLTLTFRLK